MLLAARYVHSALTVWFFIGIQRQWTMAVW